MSNYAKLQAKANTNSVCEFVPDKFGRQLGDFSVKEPVFIFRTNFGGAVRKNPDGRIVNGPGKRNFNLVLPEQFAMALKDIGFTVNAIYDKDADGRILEEDGPCYYIKVKVQSNGNNWDSVIHRLSETASGRKIKNLMTFEDDPEQGAGILDSDMIIGGKCLIHHYAHEKDPYPNGETHTAQLTSAHFIVARQDDIYDEYEDYEDSALGSYEPDADGVLVPDEMPF